LIAYHTVIGISVCLGVFLIWELKNKISPLVILMLKHFI